jgi:hypothetical protein
MAQRHRHRRSLHDRDNEQQRALLQLSSIWPRASFPEMTAVLTRQPIRAGTQTPPANGPAHTQVSALVSCSPAYIAQVINLSSLTFSKPPNATQRHATPQSNWEQPRQQTPVANTKCPVDSLARVFPASALFGFKFKPGLP